MILVLKWDRRVDSGQPTANTGRKDRGLTQRPQREGHRGHGEKTVIPSGAGRLSSSFASANASACVVEESLFAPASPEPAISCPKKKSPGRSRGVLFYKR